MQTAGGHLQASTSDPVVEQQAVAGVAAGVKQDGAQAICEHQGVAQPPGAHVLVCLVRRFWRFALALRMLKVLNIQPLMHNRQLQECYRLPACAWRTEVSVVSHR